MARVKGPVKTRLSRADMEQILANGGSVLHEGEIIDNYEDLPHPEELGEDPASIEAELLAQQAELNARLAALRAQKGESQDADESAPSGDGGDKAKKGEKPKEGAPSGDGGGQSGN